jgi:hypothetical protein
MCCCSPDLAHNEEQKFVLLGNKDKKVFETAQVKIVKIKEFKQDLSKGILL